MHDGILGREGEASLTLFDVADMAGAIADPSSKDRLGNARAFPQETDLLTRHGRMQKAGMHTEGIAFHSSP